MKIYIGTSLTHASQEHRDLIKEIRDEIAKIDNVEILEFFSDPKDFDKPQSVSDIYNHDIHHCIANADIFIAECTYPSTGLGWELGTAVEKRGILTIALAKKGSRVTRLLLGAEGEKNKNFYFREYKDKDDFIKIVKSFISNYISS